MGLMADALADAQSIVSDGDGFADAITFTTPTGQAPVVTVVCNGIAIKHATTMNEYSAPVVGKTSRITVSEAALLALGYPVRNGSDKLALKDHKVSFIDSAGNTYNGIIQTMIPNERLGIIVCDLGDRK